MPRSCDFGTFNITTTSQIVAIYMRTVSYAVTVNGSYASTTGAGDYAQDATVTIYAGSRSNYSFSGWKVNNGDITLANTNISTTTFVMPANNVTVTANWTYVGESGGSGWNTNPPPAPTPESESTSDTVPGTVNNTQVNFLMNEDGSVSLNLTAEDIENYLETNDVFIIIINDQEFVNVSFSISAILATTVSTVQIKTESGTVILTRKMLESYMTEHGDIFEISVRKGSHIVEFLRNGEAFDYNDSANPFYVSIPMRLTANTNALGYVAVRKEMTGNVIMPYSVYSNGEMTFQTASTGTFDVIYNMRAFTDVGNHWANGNITFASSRGMFGGIGKNLFSPDTSMTRAMFVQVLANIEYADLSSYSTSRFVDVQNGIWYMAAVEWAADMSIVSGYGSGRFGPEDKITREQMAAMLTNYVIYKGYALPSETTSVFNDETDISSWAFEAVKMIQAAGIVSGRPGNLYDPKGTATRAEVATVFSRFVEVYINNIVAVNTTKENAPLF